MKTHDTTVEIPELAYHLAYNTVELEGLRSRDGAQLFAAYDMAEHLEQDGGGVYRVTLDPFLLRWLHVEMLYVLLRYENEAAAASSPHSSPHGYELVWESCRAALDAISEVIASDPRIS